MKKAKKLIILALTCVMLFGSALAVYAAEVSTTDIAHDHDESICLHESETDDSLIQSRAVYRECGNIQCSTYGYGPAPFDQCVYCKTQNPSYDYHCRRCGWNPKGFECPFI